METYIVRQPLLDRDRGPFAYELRHHGSDDSDRIFGDLAGAFGMAAITGKRSAFVSTSREALVGGYATALPADLTVLDLSDAIQPDEEVAEAVTRMRQAGYRICLTVTSLAANGGLTDAWSELDMDLDFIKVDLTRVQPSDALGLAGSCRGLVVEFIAAEVTTWPEFDMLMDAGFDYAAGTFLQTPDIVVGKELPSTQVNYLNLLSRIHEPEVNLDELEAIIKREAGLSFKLLRYINSSAIGVRNEVKSIRHALVLLGSSELRRFASLVGLAELSDDKPDELVFQAVVRGRLCEQVAADAGLTDRSEELFLMGILSMVDAIIDRPLEEILERVPLSIDVKAALLGESNRLADVLDCIAGYMMCEWDVYDDASARLGLDRLLVPSLYLKSLEWVNQSVNGETAAA